VVGGFGKERGNQVSLVLISISWCDVYLTTRRGGATSDRFFPPPPPPPPPSLPPYSPSSSRALKFLARCFIQRHRRPLSAEERSEPLPLPNSHPSPVPRRAPSPHECECSSSRYRNLHTIRTDSAGARRRGTVPTHLTPTPTPPSRRISAPSDLP